jgi:hypothetical protein
MRHLPRDVNVVDALAVNLNRALRRMVETIQRPEDNRLALSSSTDEFNRCSRRFSMLPGLLQHEEQHHSDG